MRYSILTVNRDQTRKERKMTTLSYSRHGTAFAVDVETLSPKAIAYLLQYGWSQSLQDSVAGRAKKVRDEMTEKDADVSADDISAAVESDELGTMQKRMDAILNDTIGERSASVLLTPFEKAFNAICSEKLKEYAKGKNKKLPKVDSDEYKAIWEKFAEANKESFTNAANERLEAAKKVSTVEIEI